MCLNKTRAIPDLYDRKTTGQELRTLCLNPALTVRPMIEKISIQVSFYIIHHSTLFSDWIFILWNLRQRQFVQQFHLNRNNNRSNNNGNNNNTSFHLCKFFTAQRSHLSSNIERKHGVNNMNTQWNVARPANTMKIGQNVESGGWIVYKPKTKNQTQKIKY
jgi:hypothetical protein